MVQIDLPASLAFGATLAIATTPIIAANAMERRRVFFCGLVVQSLVLTPVVLLFLMCFPGWDTMYFMQRPVPPPCLVLFVAAGSVGFFLAGYSLAAKWITAAANWKAYALALFAWALVAAIPLILWDRFIHLGTYAEYHAGAEMPLIFFSGSYVLTIVFSGAVLGAALVWMARIIRRGAPDA